MRGGYHQKKVCTEIGGATFRNTAIGIEIDGMKGNRKCQKV